MKPDTIVRSLAIGDPADGPAALAAIRRTGGRAEDPTDAEVLEGIRLLAETEGLFAETAGGTVVAAAARGWPKAGPSPTASGRAADHRPRPEDRRVPGDARPFATVIDGKLAEFETFWAGARPPSPDHSRGRLSSGERSVLEPSDGPPP